MNAQRYRLAAAAAFALLGTLAYQEWRTPATDPVTANRQRAQEVLRAVCPASRDAEQVRKIGANLAAHEAARTLIWSGPQLLYASDPAFTATAPLLTGAQRAEAGWTGWAEVDLPCGLSVQRFQKAAPGH